MFESVEHLRQQIESRLAEIDQQLVEYQTLLHERETLAETLRQHPFAGTPSGRQKSGGRARRGENVDRVCGYVDQHPNATVTDIADGTGIGKAVVHNTVRSLVAKGKLERHPLRSGINSYRLARTIRRAA